MNHNCLKALIMCRIMEKEKMTETLRGKKDGATKEKCSLVIEHWSLWEATYCFSLFLPHISCRHTASAVTSGPISSQQCDRSTNYYWKGRTSEKQTEIWKASGGVRGVRILNRECWQCQSMVIFSMDEQWAGHQNNALNFTNPHIAFLQRFKRIILSRPISISLIK